MELERHLMKMTMTMAMKMESKTMEMTFPTGSGRDSLDLHDLNTEVWLIHIHRHKYVNSFFGTIFRGKYEESSLKIQLQIRNFFSTRHNCYQLSTYSCTWRSMPDFCSPDVGAETSGIESLRKGGRDVGVVWGIFLEESTRAPGTFLKRHQHHYR